MSTKFRPLSTWALLDVNLIHTDWLADPKSFSMPKASLADYFSFAFLATASIALCLPRMAVITCLCICGTEFTFWLNELGSGEPQQPGQTNSKEAGA